MLLFSHWGSVFAWCESTVSPLSQCSKRRLQLHQSAVGQRWGLHQHLRWGPLWCGGGEKHSDVLMDHSQSHLNVDLSVWTPSGWAGEREHYSHPYRAALARFHQDSLQHHLPAVSGKTPNTNTSYRAHDSFYFCTSVRVQWKYALKESCSPLIGWRIISFLNLIG